MSFSNANNNIDSMDNLLFSNFPVHTLAQPQKKQPDQIQSIKPLPPLESCQPDPYCNLFFPNANCSTPCETHVHQLAQHVHNNHNHSNNRLAASTASTNSFLETIVNMNPFASSQPSTPPDLGFTPEDANTTEDSIPLETDPQALLEQSVKKKRLARKAELARLSRRRKKVRLTDLEEENKALQAEIDRLTQLRIRDQALLLRLSQNSTMQQAAYDGFGKVSKQVKAEPSTHNPYEPTNSLPTLSSISNSNSTTNSQYNNGPSFLNSLVPASSEISQQPSSQQPETKLTFDDQIKNEIQTKTTHERSLCDRYLWCYSLSPVTLQTTV